MASKRVIAVDCRECGQPIPVFEQEVTALSYFKCAACYEQDIAILKRAVAELEAKNEKH